jgi:hypothetical protein
MDLRLEVVVVLVSDLDRAKEFYSGKAGLVRMRAPRAQVSRGDVPS